MNINELGSSNFLKKEDCMPPIKVTIAGIKHENMAQDGQPIEMKYTLQFNGDVKPMVLNKTNGQLIAHVLGSPESDDWMGKEITLYNDPTIMFAGEMKGGIRVQVPQAQTYQPGQSENPAQGVDDPF